MAFSLPAVAITKHYSSPTQSSCTACRQELSDRVDQLNDAIAKMALSELNYRFPYVHGGEPSSRLYYINKEIIKMAAELNYKFPYVGGEVSYRLDRITDELIKMADSELNYNFLIPPIAHAASHVNKR